MFKQFEIIIELHLILCRSNFSLGGHVNGLPSFQLKECLIFRALLFNRLYFNFYVLLFGDFNVQLDVKSGIIIVM